MQLSFENRTYLVTGGGSGIGKGVAAGLVSAGASVMIVGRNPDRLASAVADIEVLKAAGSIRYEPTDVTNEDETARAVDAATAWHGRLHGVVHCAGGSLTVGPITHIDSEAWRRTVDLNVNGTMYVLKHAARELVRGGGGSFVGITVGRGGSANAQTITTTPFTLQFGSLVVLVSASTTAARPPSRSTERPR